MVGGVVVAGAVVAGILYALTRKSSDASAAMDTPTGGVSDTGLDALLNEVAASRSGPDYETVLTLGDWTIDREKQFSFPNLGPGSVARVRLYPTQSGYAGPHYDYGIQITKAKRVGGFTLYEAKWINTPGGLDPNDILRITSADVASVVSSKPIA